MSTSYAGWEDLLCDDRFLAWYFRRDQTAVRQWAQWMAEHPDSEPYVGEAVAFLDRIRVDEGDLANEHIGAIEHRLAARVKDLKGPGRLRPAGRDTNSLWRPSRRWMAAAAALVLGVSAYMIFAPRSHGPAMATKFGEIRNNTLPDGTEVLVNADSRISWSSGWMDGKDREVWLQGEAYFYVKRTPLKSRFIVHGDRFDVIVTGTQFNVVSRNGKSNVMLQEGSVTLHTPEGDELKMSPGDFLEYASSRWVKRAVKQDSVVAWKEHKLSFYDTPLRDVAAIIREQYGVEVKLASEAVAAKTVSGIMPNDNLGALLKALEETPDFEVLRRGDEIIIQDHP